MRKRFYCGHTGLGVECHRCKQASRLKEMAEGKVPATSSLNKWELIAESDRLYGKQASKKKRSSKNHSIDKEQVQLP